MSQDIREWARANGHPDLGSRGRIPQGIVEEWEAANPAPEDGGGEEPILIIPTGPPPATEEPEPGPPVVTGKVEERPPVRPRRNRLRDARDRAKKEVAKKPLPRVSTATVLGFAYSGLGYLAARNEKGIPTARALDLMAPVAGEVLDDVIKGTIIDRVLQPIARSGEKGEKVAALAGFPLLTALVTARPEMFPVVRPAMRMSIVLALEVSEQPMKKLQARTERFQEKFGNIDIDGMIDAVFASLDIDTQHSADEDAAVRRAQGD
jgi:hypothetical protein